jgi:hypothetical protein
LNLVHAGGGVAPHFVPASVRRRQGEQIVHPSARTWSGQGTSRGLTLDIPRPLAPDPSGLRRTG